MAWSAKARAASARSRAKKKGLNRRSRNAFARSQRAYHKQYSTGEGQTPGDTYSMLHPKMGFKAKAAQKKGFAFEKAARGLTKPTGKRGRKKKGK